MRLTHEERQQKTDEAWAVRDVWARFRPVFEAASPVPILPTPQDRARLARQDPILSQLMTEEDEREREGLPPRFSLI